MMKNTNMNGIDAKTGFPTTLTVADLIAIDLVDEYFELPTAMRSKHRATFERPFERVTGLVPVKHD